MANYNVSVTQSIEAQPANIAAGESTTYVISNPLPATSYFTLETARNANGFYDSNSPKNTSGSFTLGTGITSLIQSDYIAGVIVQPGGGNLTFVPAVNITNSTLYLRGVGSNEGVAFPPVIPPDPDAAAFFSRVTTAGGTLTPTEQTAVNTLVVQMKAAGIWNAMKAVYPMVGASAAACAQNLKSSSFTGTFTSGWTFASTGATPNGTSAYMDTFFNSSINGNLSDGFLGTYLRTNSVGTPSCDFGNYNGSDSAITIYARFNNTQLTRWNDINDTPLSTTDSRGFRFVSRTSSTVKKIGINSSITAVNTNSVALINSKIYLSCLSTNNSPSQYSNRECAFACIGDGLTDTQVVNFYNAIQTFNTTLSRQV
jgi:hypothetical protein